MRRFIFFHKSSTILKKLIVLSLVIVFGIANFQYAKNYVFNNKKHSSIPLSNASSTHDKPKLNRAENRAVINTLIDINNSRLLYKQICMVTARKDCSKSAFQYALWFVRSQLRIKREMDTLAESYNFRLPVIPVNKSVKELDELKRLNEREFDARFREILLEYSLVNKEKLSKHLLSEDKELREIAHTYLLFTEEQLIRLNEKN